MRAKQVTALMMVATLAVTSNGVTALAAEAGESNAAVAGMTDEPDSMEAENDLKGAAVNIVTDTTNYEVSGGITAVDTTLTYGETTTIKTGVVAEPKAGQNGVELTPYKYELVENTSTAYAADKVIATNATGVFENVVLKELTGTNYIVRVWFKMAGHVTEGYVDTSALTGVTVNKVVVYLNQLHVPDVKKVVNESATAIATVATEAEVVSALKTANDLDEAYGVWSCTTNAVTTATEELGFTFTPNSNCKVDANDKVNVSGSTYVVKTPVEVVQLATDVEVVDESGATGTISGTQTLGKGGKLTLKALLTGVSAGDAPTEKKVAWTSSDPNKVSVNYIEKDNVAVITALATTTEDVTIYAKTIDGSNKEAACKIKVAEGINADDIYFDEKLPELQNNDFYALEGADKSGMKYLYLDKIEIVAPKLSVEVGEDTATKDADKYKSGDTVELTASIDADKLGDYYDTTVGVTYTWYKVGADNKTTKITTTTAGYTGAASGVLSIINVDKDELAGTYYCRVSVALDSSSASIDDIFLNATPDVETAYTTLTADSNKVVVDVTGITFGSGDLVEKDGSTSAKGKSYVYGETKDIKTKIDVTASNVKSYRVFGKQTVKDSKGNTVENPNEYEITGVVAVDADKQHLFKNKYTVQESLGTLNVGDYNIYLEVTTKDETTRVKVGDITVTQKSIAGLNSDKLSVGSITYGTALNEAKITYGDTEVDAALDFAFVDADVKAAGTYKDLKVKVSVADNNYKTDEKVTLKASVVVDKADLTVSAENVTITEGEKPEFASKADGLVGEDKLTDLTYTVVDEDGKTVTDTSKLAAGTYKIKVNVPEQKNYNVKTVDGILTVEKKEIAITSVKLNTGNFTLAVNGKKQLKATVAPADTTDNKVIKWSSSDEKIATVDSDGTVRALKAGKATITAKTVNGKTAKVKVTVKDTSVKLSTEKVTLKSLGATKTVTATVKNDNGKKVTWKSSNKKVATVDQNGKIKAVGNGDATITATVNGKKATVKVTVKQASKKVTLKVANKTVTGKTYTLKKGKTATVKATVTDAKGKKVTSKNGKITWTTSDKKIATISKSGKITAKKAGTVTIKAKTADGKTATFKVKVK